METRLDSREWSLLSEADSDQKGDTSSDILSATVQGNFLQVLRSSAGQVLLSPFARAIGDYERSAGQVPIALGTIKVQPGNVSEIDALCVAVSALHAFIQVNWTGPDLEDALLQPTELLRGLVPDAFPARSVESVDGRHVHEEARAEEALRSASIDVLTFAGEPAYHLCQAPFMLAFALRILDVLSPANLPTLPWWKLRSFSIHSRILDTPQAPPSAMLTDLLVVKELVRKQKESSEVEEEKVRWGRLLARLLVDEALALQRAGREREANQILLDAAAASGLQYAVTGAPGKRTKFQREDKMILVLLARSVNATSPEDGSTWRDPAEQAEEEDEVPDLLTSEKDATRSGWKAGPALDQPAKMPSEYLHNDDTLLERTRFTSTTQDGDQSKGRLSRSDATNPTVLDPLDSCILLGLCLNIHNTSPENGLTSSEMSAFVNRVMAHARNWSVHTMALLLRSRLEADRTRTAQRSALQLQALIDQMPTSDSSVGERLQLVHELELPSKWDMQAELARRFAVLGVLRSALEIFEQVEMWQEVVQCWGALGRQDKGIEVVRDLLQGRKAEADHVLSGKRDRDVHVGHQLSAIRQAKLWCLLGDLEVANAAEHYDRAWTVSGRRSARAARSLGGVAFANNDLPKATLWLRRALRIQPLYARSWFVLGCVYMRFDTAKGYIEAARCFRRCTSLEDEDAESWNNLASCYLRLAQHSEAVLREAQLADEGQAQSDQNAVLQGVSLTNENEMMEDDAQSDVDSLHSRDSGVAVQSDMDTDGDETETEGEQSHVGDGRGVGEERRRQQMLLPAISGSGKGGGQGAFDVKILAHRALAKALRFSHDDWRVWNNFMIVSVDCGMMNDAVRALERVVQLRGKARAAPTLLSEEGGASSNGADALESAVDIGVLNRIVDAVIRAPSSEEDAVVSAQEGQEGGVIGVGANGHPGQAAQVQHNPHEGHGLWPTVRSLFVDTLLPRISSSTALWRAYARLLFWRGQFRAALDAHLSGWRASYGAEGNAATTDKQQWLQAVEALQELCELMENFGPRVVTLLDDDDDDQQGAGTKVELDVDEAKKALSTGQRTKQEQAMANWRFRARSLVRTFIGRTKDAFDQEPEWDSLIELREFLAGSAAS